MLWIRLLIVIAGLSMVGASIVRRMWRELRGDSLDGDPRVAYCHAPAVRAIGGSARA